MIRFRFLFFCWAAATTAYSQKQTPINVQRPAHTPASKEYVASLIDSCIKRIGYNNEEALQILETASAEVMKLGDSSMIVSSTRIRGQILYRLSRTEEAIASFKDALAIAERNGMKEQQLDILVPYGITLMLRTQYDKALKLLFKGQELATIQQDTSYQESIAHNIGVVYYKLKDYSRALYYWQMASRFETLLRRPTFELPVNISLCYANLGEFENALKFLDQSISVCGTDCSAIGMMHIKYASGFIDLRLKCYKDAERAFLDSFYFAREVNDLRMQLDNICLLSEVYVSVGDESKALRYLRQAEEIIDNGIPYNMEIIKVYHKLSDLYLGRQEFEKAAQYQHKYIALRDSVYNEELTISLMQTEASYLERANEAEISAQKEIIALNKTIIDRQQTINTIAALFVFTLLALLALIYRNYLQKKTANGLLESTVRKRTQDLERSRSELLEALRQREMIIDLFHRKTCEVDGTIKGLCLTASEEVAEPVSRSYFDRIYNAIQQAGYSEIAWQHLKMNL